MLQERLDGAYGGRSGTVAPGSSVLPEPVKKERRQSILFKNKSAKLARAETRTRSNSSAPTPQLRSKIGTPKLPRRKSNVGAAEALPESDPDSDVIQKYNARRVELKRLYDNWKMYEKICEGLMETMIKKEKDAESVPQSMEKIQDQLMSTASKVKEHKGLFLMEKSNLKALWDQK